MERLKAELDRGAAAHGWDDQRWTAARIATVIAERFHIHYTARGVAYLLKRLGWSFQVPVRHATGRDEEQIQHWKRWTWPALKERGRPGVPGSASPTSPARA